MNVLVVDIGGTHVKVLASGETESRQFESGPTLLPKCMALQSQKIIEGWSYDVVSIGYPGPVLRNRPIAEPHNLGRGWVGFDFESAFACPVKLINDAAMQALGSYKGGKMLFLGLGTGLGSTMIVDGIIEPMELGHLPYKKRTYEDYVGQRGLERMGKNKWRRSVADIVARLIAALEPDDVVLSGGNVRHLKELPAGCRPGDNANAFLGGFRLWKRTGHDSRVPEQRGTHKASGQRVQPVTVIRIPQENLREQRRSNGSTRERKNSQYRKKENGIGNNDTVSHRASAH
jgi:polyphosphate glucokinase